MKNDKIVEQNTKNRETNLWEATCLIPKLEKNTFSDIVYLDLISSIIKSNQNLLKII